MVKKCDLTTEERALLKEQKYRAAAEASLREVHKRALEEAKIDAEDSPRRRVSIFYIIYFSLIILFAVALFFAIRVIRQKLADYEASRPYHVVDSVMEEYFKPGDAEKLIEVSGYVETPYEADADVVSLVEGFLSDGVENYQIASNGGEQKYAVSSKELKFAAFTIAPSGSKDDAGYDIYELKNIELMIGGSRAVSITAPNTTRVFLNGKELTGDYVVDSVESQRDRHIPDEIPTESTLTYEVKGLIGEPTVTATDRYGAEVADIAQRDGVFFDVPYTYCTVTDDVWERAVAAGEALAAYMQKDAAFWGIGQYVDSSSDLYVDLQTSDVRWANEHNGYDIVDPTVTEYVKWSDDVYSVRVKFTHVLYRWSGNFENEFDTTFYYRNVWGEWLIYDSQVN